jgi:hypothetical protein
MRPEQGSAANQLRNAAKSYGVSNIYLDYCVAQKRWPLLPLHGKQLVIQPNHRRGPRSMKLLITAVILIGLSATAANAIDLAELAPCRPAAARYCDRSAGLTFANLLQCGATLAAHSWRVSSRCREVLRKYGQM